MALIREFRAGDEAGVEECFVELQEFERGIEPRRAEGKVVAKKYLRHMFDRCAETGGRVFVLEDGGRVVGFVSVWARVKINGLVNDESEAAYVSDLVVAEAHRGQGWGLALLRRAEEYALAAGAEVLTIGVLAENARARRLYNDFGFRENQVQMLKPLRAKDGGAGRRSL